MCKKCGKGVNPTVFYKATVPEGTKSVVITQVLRSSKKFYRNPSTNNTYLVGGEVTEIEIYPEDVEWFLNLNKYGRYIFKVNQVATETINADLYAAKEVEKVSSNLQQGKEKEELVEVLTEVFPLVRRSEIEELTFVVDETKTGKPQSLINYEQELTQEDFEIIEKLAKEELLVALDDTEELIFVSGEIEKPKRGRKKKED